MASDGRVGRGCGGNVHSCIRGRDRWPRRQRQTPITARAKLLDGRARTNACTASRPARPPLYPMHEPRDDINCSLRVSAPGTDANTPSLLEAPSSIHMQLSQGSCEAPLGPRASSLRWAGRPPWSTRARFPRSRERTTCLVGPRHRLAGPGPLFSPTLAARARRPLAGKVAMRFFRLRAARHFDLYLHCARGALRA